MDKFEKDFEEFCESPGVDSGKARSYARAIRYLCDYMGINRMNIESVERIKSVELFLNDKNSSFYQGLLVFLKGRRQGSYLEKGFIRAAMKCFNEYTDK